MKEDPALTLRWNDNAIVLMIGERYFVKFNAAGAIQTAWSLAGAEMFGCDEKRRLQVEKKLLKKEIGFCRMRVTLACL